MSERLLSGSSYGVVGPDFRDTPIVMLNGLLLSFGDAVALLGYNGGVGAGGNEIVLAAGQGDGGTYAGAEISVGAGSASENGRVNIESDGTSGGTGESLVAEPVSGGALWSKLTTFQAGSPVGGGYLTPLVRDTTAVTGALYAWDNSIPNYVKIAPV